MNNETVTVPVQVTLPVLVPSQSIVDSAPLPEFISALIAAGHIDKEEAVAYLQWQTVISGLAYSMDEFLNMFRSIKENMRSQQTGLIVPDNVGKKIIVP